MRKFYKSEIDLFDSMQDIQRELCGVGDYRSVTQPGMRPPNAKQRANPNQSIGKARDERKYTSESCSDMKLF